MLCGGCPKGNKMRKHKGNCPRRNAVHGSGQVGGPPAVEGVSMPWCCFINGANLKEPNGDFLVPLGFVFYIKWVICKSLLSKLDKYSEIFSFLEIGVAS